jgi:hypothetical protein
VLCSWCGVMSTQIPHEGSGRAAIVAFAESHRTVRTDLLKILAYNALCDTVFFYGDALHVTYEDVDAFVDASFAAMMMAVVAGSGRCLLASLRPCLPAYLPAWLAAWCHGAAPSQIARRSVPGAHGGGADAQEERTHAPFTQFLTTVLVERASPASSGPSAGTPGRDTSQPLEASAGV